MNNLIDVKSKPTLRNKYLLKVSWLCGLIPLIGGWTIFLSWLICDMISYKPGVNYLPFIGFYWIIICFFIAIGGLISLVLYAIRNKEILHTEIIYALGIILLNIPCVFLIIYLFGKFEGIN